MNPPDPTGRRAVIGPAMRAAVRRVIAAAFAVAMTSLATTAQAGRDCTVAPPTLESVQRGLALAERTARTLDGTGARVVLIARAGQDLRRWGLQWSHVGLAYRDPAAAGAWRVVHKLNACGTDQAALWRHGLGQFFLDDPFEYRAAWVVPRPDLQERLLAVLTDPSRATRLHTPGYSMVAYPWSTRYQQSNQWALETIAAAESDQALDRERAQAWLRLNGYRPTSLSVDAMTRLGARLSTANVAFDDHPDSQRFAGRIDTVTADSMFDWLARTGRSGAPGVLR